VELVALAEDRRGGDDAACALLRMRLEGYHRSLPGVLAGNVLAGLILAATVWQAAGPLRVVPFLAGILLVSAIRLVQLRSFQPGANDLASLRRRACVGAAAAGIIWGYAALALWVPGNIALQALLLLIVSVMGTASAATLSHYLPAYYLSLMPCMPLAAWRALSEGGEFGIAGGGTVLLLALVIALLARGIGRAYDASYRLQLRNEGLVAELRQQAALLERSVEQAEVAARAKAEFLATVSHEIRTPANAILGGIEILGATPLDARQKQTVGVIGKAGESLVALLDDILDITRIEAGHLSLQSIGFDLKERLQDVVEVMTPKAAEKGLAIALAVGPGVPAHVRGDPARLRQILLNLVGNAVKFTQVGGVTVTAAKVGEEADGRARVRLSVIDSGIGIPPDRQSTIFDAFQQADGSIGRRYGGAGLGLAICKRLVDAMGGTIGVSSMLGRGCTFTVELPLEPVAAPAPVQDPADALPTWTRRPVLLLVEDEAINRFVAVNLLERHGFTIVSAATGQEALDLLGTTGVEAVLMDIGLPEMDGFETTRRIRALPGPQSGLPVIALTANVMPETMAKCTEAGMDGFASKPIKLPVLLRLLAAHIAPDGEGPAAVDAEPTRLESLRRDLGEDIAEMMRLQALKAVREGRAELADAWSKRARRRVGEVAHRLAGALDVVGLTEAAEEGRRLERATDQRGLADIGPAVLLFDRYLAGALERLSTPSAEAREKAPAAE